MTRDTARTSTPAPAGDFPPLPEARTLRVGSVDLCVQALGRASDPAVLLIAGAADAIDGWDDAWCAQLAARGRHVVRYDHRDTGRSSFDPPGAPRYRAADLATDALGVLDALGIRSAHLVGMSMGATIALRLALDRPERVATLTLMSATPGGDDLPPMSADLQRLFAEPAAEPDWSDRQAVIEYVVDAYRPFAGGLPFDAARRRRIAERVVDRTRSIASAMANHWLIDHAFEGPPLRERLGGIVVPALVVHGSDDPLFPPAHGQALARLLPRARLLLLEGVGHEFAPPSAWPLLTDAIVDHTRT